MELLDIAMSLHFLGLFMGGAASIGLPIVGRALSSTDAEHRPALGAVVKPLKVMGHAGVTLLILTGLWLTTSGGHWSGAPIWFWVKLVAVVLLILGIIFSGRAGKLAMTGDADAAARARKLGMANILLVVVIVVSAVLAFH